MTVSSALAILCAAGLLAACSVEGPSAVKPYPIDMHADIKPSGSAALAAPSGWKPEPTLKTPVFKASAPELLAAMQEILTAEPRTYLSASYPDQQEAFFVVHSLAMNLPDTVVVQAVPNTPTTSKAVIFSQSRHDLLPYGLNENAARVRKLLAALTMRFGTLG